MTQRMILRMFGILTLILILANVQSVIAQDKIYTKSEKTIECRVTKVDNENIEYLDGQENFGRIAKEKVKYIEFSKTPRDPIDYSDNRNKAIKLNLISLTHNALQISYEKAFDAISSIELTAKIYGVSIRQFDVRKTGGGLTLGYRYRLGSLFSRDYRGNTAHVFDGIGFKPMFGVSYAQKENEGATEKYYYAHIGSEVNYQAVFNNRVLFELYGGLHVFKGQSRLQFPNTPELTGVLDFQDGDLNGSDSVAFSAGIKFGYLFGGFGRSSKLLRW